MADKTMGKAEEFARRYEGHLKAAEAERKAARGVVTDVLDLLSDLLYGKADAFKGHERLRQEIDATRYGWHDVPDSVWECAKLKQLAEDIAGFGWYTDDVSMRIVNGDADDEDTSDSRILVITGWQKFRNEWDDTKVKVPAEILDMTQEEVDALYEEARRMAIADIEREDEERRISDEERERQRYLVLKQKYEVSATTTTTA